MSWGGFSSWASVAFDSMVHGFEFGIAVAALALLSSFVIAAVVHLARGQIR